MAHSRRGLLWSNFLKGKSAVTGTRQPALPATADGNRMVIPLPPTAPAQSHDSFTPRHSHQLATLAGDSPAESTVILRPASRGKGLTDSGRGEWRDQMFIQPRGHEKPTRPQFRTHSATLFSVTA